jgi:hypothetical protein
LFKDEACFTQEGFSTATTAMFGQKQTLILHLFTATKNTLWSTIGQTLLLTFWLGLTCYSDGSMHKFTMWCWRKSYQKCWRKFHCQSRETCGSSTMGLQLTLHIRSRNISPPLTTFTGLDRAGQWLGLPGHQTSHHIKALIYTSPVDSEKDLIALLLGQ